MDRDCRGEPDGPVYGQDRGMGRVQAVSGSQISVPGNYHQIPDAKDSAI